jgi:hypothetical protein
MKKVLLCVAFGIVAFTAAYFFAIRPWHVRWGATSAELNTSLPGDELFSAQQYVVTHAITINARPRDVWPWIRQIGQDRSGFYSYTPLENLVGCQMPSVHNIDPLWKDREPGETVWFATPKHYRAQAKMVAAIVEPERAFAMVSPNDWQRLQNGSRAEDTVWAFTLEPVGASQTRLIVRLRGNPYRNLRQRLVSDLFWEPAHFIMERKMMLTIKRLAERSALAESGSHLRSASLD